MRICIVTNVEHWDKRVVIFDISVYVLANLALFSLLLTVLKLKNVLD